MSLDAYVRFVLFLLGLLALAQLGRALWTGRWKLGGRVHRKGDDPGGYWREIALAACFVTLLAWAVFDPPLDEKGEPMTGGVLILAIFAPALVRSLSMRTASVGSRRFAMAERPVAYWTIVSFEVVLVAATIALIAAVGCL